MGRDRYGEDERRREPAREWDEGPLSAGQGGRAVTQTQARPQLSQGP